MNFDGKSLIIGLLLGIVLFFGAGISNIQNGRYTVAASENGIGILDTQTGILKSPTKGKLVVFDYKTGTVSKEKLTITE